MHNWPAFLLAAILLGYWARVMRLVYKVRRQTGRSANFRPTEPLGRMLRILWYPAVVIWLTHPWLSALRAPRHWLFTAVAYWPPAAWASVILAAGALAATWVCWKRMGRSWRMGINPNEKTQLVVNGPYAYVRHPIYALSTVLMLASLVIIPSPLMAATAAVHLALLQWEARREETYLLVHHGPAYGDYCRHVGRFFPRSLHPYRPVVAAGA